MDGLSNKLICERCAITPPTLYHHFSDKNELLEALVGQAYFEYFETKQRLPKSNDPLIRYKQGWRNFAAFAAAKPEHFRLMASAAAAGRMSNFVLEAYSYPMTDLKGISEKYGLKVSIEVAAQLTICAAFGACVLPMTSSEVPWKSDLSETVLDAVLQTILSRSEDRIECEG